LSSLKTQLPITSWLNDVARSFAQCGEAQAGTPAPRFSLCYMLKARLRKVLCKRNTDV